MKLRKGQCWTYKQAKENSFCKINAIDDEIIHISVKNILFGDEYIDISHLPFSKTKFESSIVDLIKEEDVELDDLESISIWQEDQGGVWDIPIYEAVQLTLENLESNL